MCFSAISFNHFKQLARYYVKLSQAKNVQDYSISVKFNGFLIGPGRKRRILSLFKKKNKNKKRWLLLWRDGRPTAGCSEKEFEARVALGCASSNSYASFVLSKLPACLLTHEPIFNWGRYKNVFFMLLLFDRVFHYAVLYHHKESTWPHQRQTSQATHSNRTSNNHDSVQWRY